MVRHTRLEMRLLAFTVLAALTCTTDVAAEELLPPDRPIPEVIDHYLDLKLKQVSVAPAPPADDATLVRRLTLDLAGRIPTVAEAKAYVETTDPQKRSQLIDRLMAAP